LSQSEKLLVTIGLPVFNGERYVSSAIESLLGQDYQNLELVISDNASTDTTPEILEWWAQRDNRIRLFRNPENLGAAANFNRVLELAEGQYFRWAGYDDLLEPEMLTRCVTTLEATGDRCVLVYPQTMIIDDSGNEVDVYDNRLDMRHEDPADRLRHMIRNVRLANPIFGLMRTDVIKDVGGLPAYNSGDLVMIAGLALRGWFIELPEPLFRRRMHEGMSWKAMKTPEGFASWFDPSKRHLVVFPMWRLWRELLAEVFRAPLTRRQRRKAALVVVLEWPRRKWKRLGREIVRVPRVIARQVLKKLFGNERGV
jgi:glycosyltransferase involved in cell wall biosynthesis